MDGAGYLIPEGAAGQMEMEKLENEPRLTTGTLINWAYQVSRGMNFMASKKVQSLVFYLNWTPILFGA